MSFRAIQRILGLLLMVFSLTMLPPIGVSLFYGDGSHMSFVGAAIWLIVVGGLIWWPIKLAIPVAFILLSLQGLSETIKNIAVLTGHRPMPHFKGGH